MTLLDRLDFGWGPRLPMTLQTEAAECGLACLAMVAGYYGQLSEITELRRRIPVSLKGVNLRDLIGMADRIGFVSRPVRLELDELRMLKTPCILHWDFNHFVVLKGATREGIVIHDPAVGVRRLPMPVASKHFTGVALELTSVGGFEPIQPAPRVRFRSLLGRMVGLKQSLAQLFVLALAIEIFALVGPFFIQWVVDHALATADRDLLLTLALGFGLLMLLKAAVTAMRGWIVIVLGASLTVQGRSNLFSHLMGLPAAYFEARHLGDVMSRFGSQETILQAITTDVVETVLDGLLASLTLVIMFVYSPVLAATVLGGALLYGVLRWATYTPLRSCLGGGHHLGCAARHPLSRDAARHQDDQAVQCPGGPPRALAEPAGRSAEPAAHHAKAAPAVYHFRCAAGRIAGDPGGLARRRAGDGQCHVDRHAARLPRLQGPVPRAGEQSDRPAVDLTMLRLHAERLVDAALTAPESRESPLDSGEVRPPSVGIEVRNLRFRYSENEPWVLDDVSFRVEPGETVAIVGPSGCGKTSLLKVLASLLQPSHGEILVDGEPLAHVGISCWRSMIGVVMQDDQLFAGSVADNICFFSERPHLKRIEECARLAAVHEDIVAMPMGYNTLIGDMGTVLSGGQKQRVLIARALYRQPSLLLLDEATSQLDVAAETAVSAAIRAMRVTRIIIAHRPETIRSCDRVIHLDPPCRLRERHSNEAISGDALPAGH